MRRRLPGALDRLSRGPRTAQRRQKPGMTAGNRGEIGGPRLRPYRQSRRPAQIAALFRGAAQLVQDDAAMGARSLARDDAAPASACAPVPPKLRWAAAGL